MAIKSRSFLKNENRDFNNILDTVGGPMNVKSITGTSDVQLSNADCGMVFFGTIGATTAAGSSSGFTIFYQHPQQELILKLLTLMQL